MTFLIVPAFSMATVSQRNNPQVRKGIFAKWLFGYLGQKGLEVVKVSINGNRW